MKQTPMPARASRMRLCGKQFDSEAAAKSSRPGALAVRCPDKTCGAWHARGGGLASVPILQGPRRATGFPARVKLLVRTRAGQGDPDDAVCEACGLWLGRYGGQVHHIIDRGMGGWKNAVINSAASAALLCGDPFTGCHGLATAFDAGIGAEGFWLSHSADPRLEPMTLHTGVVVWRSEDGRYLFESPEASAA